MKNPFFYTLPLFPLACFASVLFSAPLQAETKAPSLHPQERKFLKSGDPAKGFYIFENICNQCHGMTQAHYGDMLSLGIPAKTLKIWAARHEIPDGMTDEGTLKKRPATLSDPILLPYPTLEAARKANHHDAPPDLSHFSSFLKGGAGYVYEMLLSYQQPPENMTLEAGLFYNPVALTHHRRWKMAPPFEQEAAKTLTYPDGTHPTDQQMAADIVSFLQWADDPHEKARHLSGALICLYLLLMGLFAILWRANVWKK